MVEEDEDEGESVRVRLYDFTDITSRLIMQQTIHKKSEMLFVRGKHRTSLQDIPNILHAVYGLRTAVNKHFRRQRRPYLATSLFLSNEYPILHQQTKERGTERMPEVSGQLLTRMVAQMDYG